MCNEWPIINVNSIFEENRWSVLHKLPYINGQNIVNAVVKPLAGNVIKASSSSRDPVSGGLPGSSSIGTAGQHSISDPPSSDIETINYLKTDRDVQWVMEVICFGLSLPINTTEQHEAIRDCVHIYCEWMYALIPHESAIKIIPSPIMNDPNHYYRRIIQHLYNVFIPRTNTNGSTNPSHQNASADLNSNDIISRQALLCHRVLRTIGCITQDENNIMDEETWDLLLLFLLSINNSLLAPPTEKQDIGRTKLCERVISVLFEIWIIACYKFFPNPSYWKTFHHLCCSWRHQPALIDQWSRVCFIFTQRLLQLTYDSATSPSLSPSSSADFGSPLIATYCIQSINKMPKEIVSEAWYKFLHTIGNPVDLYSPAIISKTCKFHHYIADSVVDPRQHPCLNDLPQIFYRAMKGVAMLVDSFLGLPVSFDIDLNDNESTKSGATISSSASSFGIVPPPRKQSSVKSGSSTTTKGSRKGGLLSGLSHASKPSQQHHQQQQQQQQHQQAAQQIQTSSSFPTTSSVPTPSPPTTSSQTRYLRNLTFNQTKPKINSVLNALGNWLFNACMIGTKYVQNEPSSEGSEHSEGSTSTTTGGDNFASRKGSIGAGSDRISLELSSSLSPENFEAGQSEAIGALCRLFSSKKTDEDIRPLYLARFYLALQYGLSVKENTRGQVLSSILLNGTRLFQINLNGINILIPDFLRAMETVINDSDSEFKSSSSITDLRRACINLLLSMISYPLHFNELPIKDSLTDSSPITFRSLRPRFINFMINALKTEHDSLNVQMLLGGLLVCVQDSFIKDKEANKGSNTAREIYSRSLNLVCQLLSNNWKNDTQVSLAALETLVVLARIKFTEVDETESGLPSIIDECKLITKWICDFIVYQCSRPPPHHSKDMHSTIVAAYCCLNVWFHEHSCVLNDRECIDTLMEVIELGISGSKSRSSNGLVLKTNKELKPASMRVREAAESLLTCLMNHFGNCPPAPCPPETVTGCCLLDEASILRGLGVDVDINAVDSWSKYFKYFIADNSILLAFVNHPPAQRSICIIRSPFGKYCWSMKFQVLSLQRSTDRSSFESIPRPPPHSTPSTRRTVFPRFIPESLEKIPLTKLDMVIPSLSNLIKSNQTLKGDHEKMNKIIEKQALSEKELEKRCLPLIFSSDLSQPKPKDELECSRLILSHLGFISLGSGQKSCDFTSRVPSLISLDKKNSELFNNIKTLDMISTRTSDTAFIFYVRKGRVHPQEILNSVSSKHYVSSSFIDFLNGLGCSIKVNQHHGWTGNVYTSWKARDDDSLSDDRESYDDHGGSAYDGNKMVLYWADVCNEIAFIVPSGRLPEDDSISIDSEVKGRAKSTEGSETVDLRSLSSLSDDGTNTSNFSRNLSEAESTRNSWRKKNKHLSFIGNVGCDTKILIIWLESIDDEATIPSSTLLTVTNTGVETNPLSKKDYIAILVHPLKNGLFTVKIVTSLSRPPTALPLLDGMVVSQRVLSIFVRLTCLNLCRRRRLDAESFQPPHVKRRLKIQEMAKKLQANMDQSEFYYSLFT
ncbi:ral GTPase-activating protein subunit beta isoform X2 [Tetranychus urticae]|uniref:ral GTPase-activating protein subunit beta isoform X2 n=1 Tax=Tetranychus urticae TaxID=32264 RepID=UPI00077B9335|nr:ral GTPase-activating protein subunit beta isoform X2 [Tetranychus urticae]